MDVLDRFREVKRVAVLVERFGLLQSVLRLQSRRRLRRLRPGVTIVIATWNSDEFLPIALKGIRRFTDATTQILVVDNHSDVNPRPLCDLFSARLIRLPANLRHSVALDIGFLLSSTEYVMSLDADAFPFSESWLPTFLEPLGKGFDVVGCECAREYAHPCCLAMRTETFVSGRHTFRAQESQDGGHEGWNDVGELISRRAGPDRVAIVPKTDSVHGGEWFVGATFGDVVYHNAYSSRHLHLPSPNSDGLDPSEDFVMTRHFALDTWNEALGRWGPATWH
ncbi:MAG TPA: glycosyltransferase [Acidimicrobiales bacterium]